MRPLSFRQTNANNQGNQNEHFNAGHDCSYFDRHLFMCSYEFALIHRWDRYFHHFITYCILIPSVSIRNWVSISKWEWSFQFWGILWSSSFLQFKQIRRRHSWYISDSKWAPRLTIMFHPQRSWCWPKWAQYHFEVEFYSWSAAVANILFVKKNFLRHFHEELWNARCGLSNPSEFSCN